MRKDYYAINLVGESVNINVKSIYRTDFDESEIYKFNINDDVYYSYVIITKGTIIIHYKQNLSITLTEGNAVFLWSKDTESIEIIGSECSYYWVYFTVFGCSLPLLKSFDAKTTTADYEKFDLMIKYLDNHNIFDSTRVNMMFIDYLLSGIEKLDEMLENFSSLYRIEIINSINYIKTNISKDFSIEDLANLQNMNINQFRKYFKIIVGEYPAKYIYEQRLLLAKDYLLNTNYTLGQISEYVGFDNPYYLSNCFRKKYGLSPKKYVAKNRNQ